MKYKKGTLFKTPLGDGKVVNTLPDGSVNVRVSGVICTCTPRDIKPI